MKYIAGLIAGLGLTLLLIRPLWASGGGPWFEYRVTAKSGLRLRKEPSLQAEKLALIPHGTILTDIHGMDAKGSKPGWIETYYDSKHGYVSAEYLEIPVRKMPGFQCSDFIQIVQANKAQKRRLLARLPLPFAWDGHEIDVNISDESNLTDLEYYARELLKKPD